MTDEKTDEIESYSASEPDTMVVRAGGRTWEGTPQEFRDLRDRLNTVEFVERTEGDDE